MWFPDWARTNKRFLICGLVLLFLLWRNPFSSRTLIPNLEPFPDSIHYLSPALSFIQGKGLYISREGRQILPGVPPLYSIALMPALLIKQDVRMFYFVNVILAFVSLGIFYHIVKQLFPSKAMQFFLLFLYATNFTIYWFPELAMAENLLLPIALLAIDLLLQRPTSKIAIGVAIVAVAFYATKFASLPLSLVVPALFALRLFLSRKQPKLRKTAMVFAVGMLVSGGTYLLYEYMVRSNNLVGGLLNLFVSVFSPQQIVTAANNQGGGGTGFFSLGYVRVDLNAYAHWLFGYPMTVLWKQIGILPKFLAFPAMVGLLASLATKKRWPALVIITMLLSVMLFMMTFYVADGRYFIIAIPAVLLAVGFFIQWFSGLFRKHKRTVLLGLTVILLLTYTGASVKRLKFDVMLNLKYAETPWYYLSVRTFDDYLKAHRSEFKSEPVIISALPPYLVDFYAKEKFMIVPLSASQEFQTRKVEAWGQLDYEHLDDVYANLLQSGRPVFLTGYGLGNEKFLHDRFTEVTSRFTATKVESGCYDLCNVYQLEIKHATK